MLFRKKSKATDTPAPYQGERSSLEGIDAALHVEQAAADALLLTMASTWDRPDALAVTTTATVRRAPDDKTLFGLLEGFAAVGLRTTGFTEGPTLDAAITTLAELSRRRLPLVWHHLARPGGEEAAFDALARSGPFLFYASTVQEAADFTLIARRLAETALNPGLCLQDVAATGASLQSLFVPQADLVETYLGRAADTITSPTPAQELLYGPQRRRVPALLDLDRPLGIGVTHEPGIDFIAHAAGTPFFLDHLGALADDALAQYGEHTGRVYERVQGIQLDSADYVIVAEGAIVEPLLEVVDYLRNHAGLKAGVLKVNVRRPFPGPRVAALLKGKKGVTVLTRTQPGLAGEGTLLREVRTALEHALENGRTRTKQPPYPAYASYESLADRPPLYEAYYGDELAPPFADLCAVYMNMLPDATGRRQVFLGVPFQNPGIRLPKVERLQQQLRKGYPDLEQYSLPPVEASVPRKPSTGLFALVAEARNTTFTAGKTFARACQAGLEGRIRTHTNGSRLQSLRPGLFVTAHASEQDPLPSPARTWDAALVSSPFFWDETDNLAEGSLLVTHWNPDQAAALKSALARSLTALQRKQVRIRYIDAHKIAADLSDNPQHRPLLALTALYGAFVAVYPAFTDEQKARIRPRWLTELTSALEVDKGLVEGLHQALDKGAEQVAELPLFDLVQETNILPEQDVPWTVRSEQQVDGTLYDLGRFWDSTGYLIESGRQDQLLADPFLATETIPARSSAIHDHAPFRDQLPQLLPEKCTACGTCWISCPDSALPVTIQDLDTLIETAMAQCKAAGHPLLQLSRIQKHLGPQAQRLFADAGSATYGTLGGLLQDAFDGLLDKMKPADDQRQTLETEFALVHAVANGFPLVKTATFFDTPEGQKKGDGLVFSLVVNPDACKACRTCVEVCPEEAMVARTQTPERLDEARTNWRFMRHLPDVAQDRIAPFIQDADPATLAYHLLNRKAYHAALGGDLTEPGSGKKTVVHLLAGLIEADLQPRINAFVAQVADLMDRIAQKIDARLHDAVQVDDMASLVDKLSDLKASQVDMAELAPLLKEKGDHSIDKAWLTQLADAYKQLSTLKAAYLDAAHGDGRARMVMGIADSEVTRWARTFPHNPYPFPWICYASEGASGLAEGLYEGVGRQMADSFKTVRKAQLYLGNKYKPSEHDAFFEQFGRHDFTDEERALCPPVLVLTTPEGGSTDQLLNRSLPVKVLVIAEAHSLTERQSTGTPAPSTAFTAVTYPDVYVLQSSIGTPEHLMPGFLDGLRYDGPAVFYVYAPSPTRDGIPSHEVIPQARRAVRSRAFPLFTFNPATSGTIFDKFDLSMNPMPDFDWAQETPDDAEATDAEPYTVTFADWAAHEGLLKHHFTPLADTNGTSERIALHTYLDLSEKDRNGKTPVVQQPGAPANPLAVSDEMVALTAWHRDRWRLLQSLPGHRTALILPEEELAAYKRRTVLETHTLLTRKLLALSGFAPSPPETTAS